MSVQSFTVGSSQYNAAMASAVDQDKLLSLLSAALMERWVVAASEGVQPDDTILMSLFLAMPHAVKSQCVAILMRKVFVAGTDRPVTVADFGGRLIEYNTLLVELLKWNLGDFFDWLPGVAKSAEPKAAPGSQAQ